MLLSPGFLFFLLKALHGSMFCYLLSHLKNIFIDVMHDYVLEVTDCHCMYYMKEGCNENMEFL